MRHTPHYLMTDPDEVKRLIRNNPWATFVSPVNGELVASHYPVILDEAASQGSAITILSHFGRPDDELHELGQHQVLVIIQGPHDYVSPSWYASGDLIPTWNHVTAHLYGTPQILTEEENYAALGQLTDYFERHQPHGRSLSEDEAGTRRAAKGTRGLLMRVDRFDARAKLSQNKSPEVIENVTNQLADRNPTLAEEMRRNQQQTTPADGPADGPADAI
jgi:transcriptional regulator